MSIAPWAAKYIGIPFVPHGRKRAGCDCWGLVRIILDLEYGVGLPAYEVPYTCWGLSGAEEVGVLFADDWPLPGWREHTLQKIGPGDLVLFRVAQILCHIGIAAGDGFFLHSFEGRDSCLERFDSPRWNRRIGGVYRHG